VSDEELLDMISEFLKKEPAIESVYLLNYEELEVSSSDGTLFNLRVESDREQI
jgi:hypothetical protein